MKTYQIECGDISGYANAGSPGSAFRKLFKVMKGKSTGELAAFREVEPLKKDPKPLTPWFYQDPKALLTD